MSDTPITTTLEHGVFHILLNRPERKNALNLPLMRALTAALQRAHEDDGIRVVLLSGAGGHFSSGMDLSADFSESDNRAVYDACMGLLIDFEKPIVAAVEGIAIGGGATLAYHADILYAADTLRMRLPFVSLALCPEFASSYTLQANIGYRRAAELMFTADWIDAPRAQALGIATEVFPADTLLATAMEKARTIAQWPVNSLRVTKRCMKAHHKAPMREVASLEMDLLASQIGSPENIEAFTAFMEKRPPRFHPD